MDVAEKLKLDAICNEAKAKLDNMAGRMYKLGWVCFGGHSYNKTRREIERGNGGPALKTIKPDPSKHNGNGGPLVGGYEPKPEPVKPQPGAAAMLREFI